MTTYVRAANPIWFMVDLVGLPLNDEYYALFLQNEFPYVPQLVYRDPQGDTAWGGGVVQFLPNGTLPNNLYFDPSSVYRIEIRHGNSQSDALIYEINDFVPPEQSVTPPTSISLSSNNQITNPEFKYINFVSPLTSTENEIDVGAGWKIISSGSGSIMVEQLTFPGDQNLATNVPVNAAYGIRITTSGTWDDVTLQQKFNGNGALWARGSVAASITSKSNDGINHPLQVKYLPSEGDEITIIDGNMSLSEYVSVSNAAVLPASTNTDSPDDAFVKINITIPVIGSVDLTSFQIVGQDEPLPVAYAQETPEREADHLFHYYKNELVEKPKASILSGWNFSLNPFQFSPTALTTITTLTQYICDQTILHQTATSSVEVGKSAVGTRQCLEIKAINGVVNNRFALIQYVDAKTIKPYWGYLLSSLMRAQILTTQGTTVGVKMCLIYRSGLPPTLGAAEPIASFGSPGSVPSFSGGWTVVTPLNDPTYSLGPSDVPPEGESSFKAYPYNQFQLPICDNAEMTLGIVVYTANNLSDVSGNEDSLLVESISLVKNSFAVESEPQTFDQVLKECEFYFEKSYAQGVEIGHATVENSLLRIQTTQLPTSSGSRLGWYKAPFNFDFKNIKRTRAPDVSIYDLAGTQDSIKFSVLIGGVPASGGGWDPNPVNLPLPTDYAIVADAGNSGDKQASFYNTAATQPPVQNSTGGTGNEPDAIGVVQFHYTVDARLGLVV